MLDTIPWIKTLWHCVQLSTIGKCFEHRGISEWLQAAAADGDDIPLAVLSMSDEDLLIAHIPVELPAAPSLDVFKLFVVVFVCVFLDVFKARVCTAAF